MTSAEFVNKTVDEWLKEAKNAGELELSPSAHCRVCKDPVIMGLVNKMLSMGFSIPAILDTLESHNLKLERDGKPTIKRDSLYNHRTEHFNVQVPAAAQWRKIQEKRAQEFGQDWETGVGTILNAASILETIMIKGFETLMDPKTVVSPREAAWAGLKLQELIDARSGEADMVTVRAKMGRIIEVVRRFIPEDQWPDVQAALSGEEPVRQPTQAVEGVRMIQIDDTPEEES